MKELATLSPSQLHILGMEAIVLAKLYRSSQIGDIPDSGKVKRRDKRKKRKLPLFSPSKLHVLGIVLAKLYSYAEVTDRKKRRKVEKKL